ncbi:MAG: MerR family transcriptional regulator [Candidatus Cryptobacteroides sp.]
MEKIYYTMKEVAQILNVTQSCLRFWSDSFSDFVKPDRNAKGNRLFHKEDVEMLKLINHLLKEEKLTIDGCIRKLKSENPKYDKRDKVIVTLKDIKAQLLEIKQSL